MNLVYMISKISEICQHSMNLIITIRFMPFPPAEVCVIYKDHIKSSNRASNLAQKNLTFPCSTAALTPGTPHPVRASHTCSLIARTERDSSSVNTLCHKSLQIFVITHSMLHILKLEQMIITTKK